MSFIGKFIYSSDSINEVTSPYLSPDQFLRLYKANSEEDNQLLLKHVIRFNVPFVFKDKPLIFEQVRNYLAELLDIDITDILVIGSAKTGFSMSTTEFGKPFSGKSDIDFTIINKELFDKAKEDYRLWRKLYLEEGKIKPRPGNEEIYWQENISVVSNNLSKGFVDCGKVPNRDCCPTVKKINNSMFNIKQRLSNEFKIEISKATVRIYKDFKSFETQFNRNTNYLRTQQVKLYQPGN